MCQNSKSNHMVLGATWARIAKDSYVFWLIWVQVPYDFVWFRADLGSHPVWMCMVLDTCWLRSHMDSYGLGFVGAQISYEFICLWADMGHSSIWDHILWTISSAYWINMGTRRMKRDRGKCVTKQLTWEFSMFLPPSGRPTLKPNSQKSPPDRSKINQKNVRILMHLSWIFNPTWGRFWTWDCWTKFEARLSKMLNNIRKSRPWICYQWFVVKEITGVAPVIVVVEVLV